LALTQNLKHNHVLHEHVLIVAVTTAEKPRVPEDERIHASPVCNGITRVDLCFGFMEQPDVPAALRSAMARGQIVVGEGRDLTYFTGHETIIPAGHLSAMAPWRESLFALMHHNAQRPGAYFRIPASQIMEIGVEFEI
jgi:KUP system potassium uptake protein